jgi:4-amino-4-deoxy-L-arabinose transferase-like glycosyltransferase
MPRPAVWALHTDNLLVSFSKIPLVLSPSPHLQRLLLIALCLLLWLPGFTALPVIDRDEARYAQASRQMVHTGDYIDIRFQDEARHKKPIGIYWLQAASVQLSGVSDAIWAFRLPSLLCAMAAVLMMSGMAASLFGQAAFLPAGVLLAGCFLMGVGARVATTDAALLASVLAAQWMLSKAYLASFSAAARIHTAQAATFWIAVAVGALIKGPVILAVVGLTVLALCGFSRSLRWSLVLRPQWGLPLFLAVLLPWFVAITLRSDGSFWVDSLQKDILSKAVSVQESHGAPPGTYLLSLLLTFWPWTALLVPATWWAVKQRTHTGVQLCLAWAGPAWLMFELAPTKLPHYVLPLFPPLVALVVLALRDWALLPSWLRSGTVVLWLLLAGSVGAGLAAVPAAVGQAWSPWLLAAGCSVPLAIGGGLWWSNNLAGGPHTARFNPTHAIYCALVGLVALQIAFWAYTLPRLERPWLSQSAATLLKPHRALCPGPVLSAGYEEPSLVFTLGTETQLGASRVSALTRERCHLVFVDEPQLAAVKQQLGGRSLTPLGAVTGYNYSTSRDVVLTLYRLEAQP